jgi:glycine dehydrogenase subunit 2
MSKKGRVGFNPTPDPDIRKVTEKADEYIPRAMQRAQIPLPELSELQVLRHFNRLSQMNFSVELGTYPLGSCTMKYNPKVSEYVASSDGIRSAHPLQPDESVQGLLAVFYDLSQILQELTGMVQFSLAPAAGAQGELAGVLMIRKYLHNKGLSEKDEILVPDSVHGTNPASASMAGFRVVKVPSEQTGLVSAKTVERLATEKTAGMMFTVPNTLGLFEADVREISKIIHGVDGLMYYDGANMNALLGKARPGDMGFDIVHLNLHKTFATPHGGGGPGAGPVGAVEKLAAYLPIPLVSKGDNGSYYLNNSVPNSIGRIKGFVGNSAVLLRALTYILLLGRDGLSDVSSLSVLAGNYLMKRLDPDGYALAHGKGLRRKHEVVVSVESELPGAAMNVAKALLDYGVHAPTVYFPLIVKEALMIEPTESEPVEALDDYAAAMNSIYRAMKSDSLGDVPQQTSVSRVDEVKASHPATLRTRW